MIFRAVGWEYAGSNSWAAMGIVVYVDFESRLRNPLGS
jgi:hypothetical protein